MTESNNNLWLLVAAVANSPIVVPAPEAPARDFADWCGRQNADMDAVVLAWLRAQAPSRRRSSLS